ncbi:response regulator transcription factor [Aureibacter tunicatorum]|uniref:DNA-binding NarL/FixJ family response regulator n=1 Tax=Aureibacter tunicatorum TaxID=866807 RepID=A0AAE3XIN9_9BACT|nr:LuxR C-terminal-related transcriptional regulator [Aureibacter tunicatorum]MDR6237140.1 DNA-binding NarL/FixJ family response regulator [Aureibacter tunicatorum]BDD06132.1 hypothetical protein AUTU_36150 [Aureibacter tunicatorum]
MTTTNNKQNTNIFIISDKNLVAEGLKLCLGKISFISNIYIQNNFEKIRSMLQSHQQEDNQWIFIIELDSDCNYSQYLDTIGSLFPYIDCKYIALYPSYELENNSHWLEKGFNAYLPINICCHEFRTAIEAIHLQGYYINKNHIADIRIKPEGDKKDSIQDLLTPRQIEIIELIVCQQMSNEEIAEKLFISKRTVEGHRIRILNALKLKNTLGLVVMAMMNNWFSHETIKIKTQDI